MHVSSQDDGAPKSPSIESYKEVIMFHVLDHAYVAFSGDLSQATQYVIEHSGKRLDEAIGSGIRILYTDELHRLNEALQAVVIDRPRKYWDPVEDWEID